MTNLIPTKQIQGGSIEFMMAPRRLAVGGQVFGSIANYLLPGSRLWEVSSFRVSTNLITRHQWHAVMGTRPWTASKDQRIFPDAVRDDFPATFVSYEEAMKFCSKLNRPGKKIRLPTELEWEYLYREGENDWLFSSWKSNDFANESARDYAVFCARGQKSTECFLSPVGTKKPNAFGVFDMVGLVSEYVYDRYEMEMYSGRFSHGKIPKAAKDFIFADGKMAVKKGGDFESPLLSCCYMMRVCTEFKQREAQCGFRIVEVDG